MGFSVLRFADADVKQNVSGVAMAIDMWIEGIPLPPLSKGGFSSNNTFIQSQYRQVKGDIILNANFRNESR